MFTKMQYYTTHILKFRTDYVIYNRCVHRRSQRSEKAVLLLIQGEKKYQHFTKAEKKLVDKYQKKIYEEGGDIILPNTAASVEQEKFEDFLLKSDQYRGQDSIEEYLIKKCGER